MAESTLTPRVRTRCQPRIHLVPGASTEDTIAVDPNQFATHVHPRSSFHCDKTAPPYGYGISGRCSADAPSVASPMAPLP